MKDLVCQRRLRARLSPDVQGASVAAITIDTKSNTTYSVFHSQPSDTGVAAFQIFSTTYVAAVPHTKPLIRVNLVASPAGPSDQAASRPHSSSQVPSFTYLADGGSAVGDEPAICLVTTGGDIVLIPVVQTDDSAPVEAQIVGSVEQGILAASWSPDEEAIILVVPDEEEHECQTGKQQTSLPREKMLVMSREFEVLDEKLIREQGRGEEQISVGWGSKATQFHGSAGKAAATETGVLSAEAEIQPLRDDDLLPHISWRGDCAFYVISSLEPLESGRGTRRIVRTFDRAGNLAAVSDENETGLSHVAAMKPTGNLFATSQRFAAEAAASDATYARGRTNRHDIVFFERNGLPRGGFSLREEAGATMDGAEGGITEPPLMDKAHKEHKTATDGFDREHEIVDIKWNCDGSCLGVWLRRSGVDVIQIWTMANWHWYLKQEIQSPAGSNSQLCSWMWHPEQALTVLEAWSSEEGALLQTTGFHSSTHGQALLQPSFASGVAVTDGGVQRVTFFDKQTIPPPMCSLVLPTSKSAVWRSVLEAESIPADVEGELGGWTPRHKAWAEAELRQGGSKAVISVLALLHPTKNFVQFHSFLFTSPKAAAVPAYLGRYQLAVSGNWQPRQLALTARADDKGGLTLSVASIGDADVESGATAVYTKLECSFADWLHPGAVATTSVEQTIGLARAQGSAYALFVSPSAVGADAFLVHSEDGEVHQLFSSHSETSLPLATLDEFCPAIAAHGSQDDATYITGLSSTGKLYAAELPTAESDHLVDSQCSTLARDATSFLVSPPFLIWINTAHEARFLPLSSLSNARFAASSDLATIDRRVERGAKIVTAAPRQMALILQMPRGNVERIFPRGMVLDRVRTELDRGRYKAAFLHCRSNRVDLNLLFDHNPQVFLDNVGEFVAQIDDVDHFNLFLSSIKAEDVTKTQYKPLGVSQEEGGPTDSSTKVNRICDAFIKELTVKNDNKRFINSILTAHVKKMPADYESALSLLRDLKGTEQELVDAAIEYIIFLAPFDSLFDVALGMYDLTLALMVAQHSKKKDPREYLPFLRELKDVQPMEMQRFQIDDHLKRYGKALKWLAKAGEEHHEEAMQYLYRYRLFGEGLQAFAGNAEKWRKVQGLYGDYLMERQKWTDAGLAYQLANDVPKALEAFRAGGTWQEAFSVALQHLAKDEIQSLVTSMAGRLEDTARYAEAARVRLEYGRDVEGAVESYVKANELTECRRVCAAYNRLDLIETHIKPAALAAQETQLDELREMSEQLAKQLARLAELRKKKAEQPGAFYGEDSPNDGALDYIDVQSDTSTQITQFTRYTKVPSHAGTLSSLSATSKGTGTTRRGERRMKKKEEKAKATGKKGSVYEEDYLYESVQKLLAERLAAAQDNAARLLPNLVVLGAPHRTAALALQDALVAFEAEATAAAEALADVAFQAGVAADEARLAALAERGFGPTNPAGAGAGAAAGGGAAPIITIALLDLLAGNTRLDKAAQRKKPEVAQRKWKSEMLEVTMRG